MRCMVLVKADKNTEAGVMPSEKLLADMGKYDEELAKAGILLSAEGLHPSSKGARVRFSGARRTVVDGPFKDSKDLRARPRSRSARCSRRTTSARSSHLSCGKPSSACAIRSPRRGSSGREFSQARKGVTA
jgi:hypothetical protein